MDDLDGSEAAETITFALDGRTYELDLSEANAAKLRDVFAPYVAVARRVPTSKQAAPQPERDYDPKAVRIWARARGIETPKRGRIPASVLEQYRAAGN